MTQSDENNDKNPEEMAAANEKQVSSMANTNRVFTGFSELDKITGGLQNYELILIAGRGGMGLLPLVLNMASHMTIRDRKSVLIFSLEMPREQLAMRMMCAEGWIDQDEFKKKTVSVTAWVRIKETGDRLLYSTLMIDDTPNISVEALCNKARETKKTRGLNCIIIDSLQFLSDGEKAKTFCRREQINNIAHKLKALGRDLKVPIIVVSRLNSKIDNRVSCSRPSLRDFKEESGMEEVADLIAFLYREDYYYSESERPNIAELIIAKHRNGPAGTIELYYHKPHVRFTDIPTDFPKTGE